MPKSKALETCPRCGNALAAGHCEACGYPGEDTRNARSQEDGSKRPDGCKGKKDGCKLDSCGMKDSCRLGMPEEEEEMEDGCKGRKVKADGISKSQIRADYWGPMNESVRNTSPFQKTDEGFLTGRAAITCVGVFRYMDEKGNIRNEFRPPEEVFRKESVASFAGKPVTNTHPAGKVTPETYKSVAVGSVGKSLENEAYNVYADLTVTDAQAIQEAEGGRTGLSCGYTCDVVTSGEVSYPVMGWDYEKGEEKEIGRTVYKVPGNWGGVQYDAIQTNIVGNHVALVDIPRGGDALHMRFDSSDVGVGVRVNKEDTAHHNSVREGDQMKKIRLDGAVEHEVPEAVALHIDAQDAKIKALATDKADAEAKLAAANASLAAVTKERDDAASALPAKIAEGVAARLALKEKADGFGVEVKADESDDSIKAKVIAAALPDVKVDGMDAVNLNAHFDAACALLSKQTKDDGVQRQVAQVTSAPRQEQKADSVEDKFQIAWKSSK